jgi:proteasome lid subunit RPN8/RPN11
METSIVPKIYDASIADGELGIETEAAYSDGQRLAREEGLLIGVSAAAALVGALKVAKMPPRVGCRHHLSRLGRQVSERAFLGRERVRQGGIKHGTEDTADTLQSVAPARRRDLSARVLRRAGGRALTKRAERRSRPRCAAATRAPTRRRIAITSSPAELVRIQREAMLAGHDIVGFYHSHPDHPAHVVRDRSCRSALDRLLVCDHQR